MKQTINNLILKAATRAYQKGDLPSGEFSEIEIEEPKYDAHGDFSTNIAMKMASVQKISPRKIAEVIIDQMDDPDRIIKKTEIAGPGFINFFLKASFWYPVLRKIHDKGSKYGSSNIGNREKIQVEFVSSNPTGPLHIGHGRGAAVGDSIGNILSFCGYEIQKEYYINDSGRQIYTLGRSVYLRYKELIGQPISFPPECYQGDYIREFAAFVKADKGSKLLDMDEENAISYCAKLMAKKILSGIHQDLNAFGVKFDNWFSEQSLYDAGMVDEIINNFQQREIIYQKDGALWFNTHKFGDEKDRVVVKKNGQTTYFASDIAYHMDKYHRGFDRVIDVWGADHHGYIPRVAAAIEASGKHRNQFQVILVHLVNLLRGGEPVAMSTRMGQFITLRNIIDEVGRDAARFIFLTRHHESPLDFDLEVAKKKTNENPVYYVQYVHARIASIARKGKDWGKIDVTWDEQAVNRLRTPEEIQLMKAMARYPDVVQHSANSLEPHHITYYLTHLAALFHAYYNKHRVLTDDPILSHGRLYLVFAVKKVIKSGLTLLGVSAPEKM
ncbi:MAG TPA: arginine--tRNA ligase [Desulfobacterales bacterium]|nr:arginine--tRNA ligase [Desulfobacterales bacterium]